MRDRTKLHIERGEPLSPTQHGRICPTCARPKSACECRPVQGSSPPADPHDGIVRVSRQTKGRKGKGVTRVTGLRLAPDELAALGKTLKQRCGAGGTSKDGVIEIQGDHRDAVIAELQALGHTVKRAGG